LPAPIMRLSLTKVLPRHHPNSSPSPGRASGATERGGRPQLVWGALVPRSVHPLTVAIVEALLWIETPLSPAELRELLSGEFSVSYVSYHLRTLAETGTLARVGERLEDRAVQPLFFFPEERWVRDSAALEAA
jgi:Helix-turn-helix domain